MRGGDAGRPDMFVNEWFPKGSNEVREGGGVIPETMNYENQKLLKADGRVDGPHLLLYIPPRIAGHRGCAG